MIQPDEKPNYWWEMVKHPLQVSSGSLSVIAASGLLVASGGMAAAIPLVAYVGGLGVVSLFLPANAGFRDSVDKRKRREKRETIRSRLSQKIHMKRPRSGDDDQVDVTWRRTYDDYKSRYSRLRERLDALRRLASNPQTRLSDHEIEKLDDASVDFLRLFYARIILRERIMSDDGEVASQLASVETQLSREGLAVADQARLKSAKLTLERVAEQRGRLPVKDAAASAQLISMSEAFEEIYHRVSTDPHSGSMSDFLAEATERMTIEEELEAELDMELEDVTARSRRRAQSA